MPSSHLATGVKIGEVTDTSAIVWMRRTEKDARDADGACPGAAGRVRLRYWSRENLGDTVATDWEEVVEAEDFTRRFRLTHLQPGTRYDFLAEAALQTGVRGSFRTAPPPGIPADVTFTVITGQACHDLDAPEGFNIYPAMASLDPAFIVPTGDTVYYDTDPPAAKSPALARFHWQRMYSLPRLVDFHLRVPGYWEKDDHDTWINDCWPGMKADFGTLTFAEGQRIFREQVPMGERTHRTFRWGKNLQVWLPEGRDFRSPNDMRDGPEKSIWGAEQKAWLKRTVAESDATWKVLVSPTPIVGPDRKGKGDNHANAAFATEGREVRAWIREVGVDRMFVACGDRHWQYHSVDPETGVNEFSCGPASDAHAGGSPGQDARYHRFHRVKGGFLSVSVSRPAGRPTIAFRFHDVGGNVVYESRATRE